MHYRARQPVERPLFGIALHHASGFHLSGPNTGSSQYEIDLITGEGYVDYTIASLSLLQGTYLFSAAIYDQHGVHPYDHHSMAYTLRVTGEKGIPEEYGVVRLQGTWNLNESPTTSAGARSEDHTP
jgi:lipopolysaccharide transport system ATP-binding protein